MTNYTDFALATAAPTPVHRGEVISVIAEELWACFSIGYGYALGVVANSTRDLTETNEALSRADISWSAYEAEGKVDITPPHVVDTLAEAALASTQSWAKDVNAFYNTDLLRKMVYELCNDWFEVGTKARPDTFPAFEAEYCSAVAEAISAVQHITRS